MDIKETDAVRYEDPQLPISNNISRLRTSLNTTNAYPASPPLTSVDVIANPLSRVVKIEEMKPSAAIALIVMWDWGC